MEPVTADFGGYFLVKEMATRVDTIPAKTMNGFVLVDKVSGH
jgi:hypothetical protein